MENKKNKKLRKIRKSVNYTKREKDEILKDSKIKRKEDLNHTIIINNIM